MAEEEGRRCEKDEDQMKDIAEGLLTAKVDRVEDNTEEASEKLK